MKEEPHKQIMRFDTMANNQLPSLAANMFAQFIGGTALLSALLLPFWLEPFTGMLIRLFEATWTPAVPVDPGPYCNLPGL